MAATTEFNGSADALVRQPDALARGFSRRKLFAPAALIAGEGARGPNRREALAKKTVGRYPLFTAFCLPRFGFRLRDEWQHASVFERVPGGDAACLHYKLRPARHFPQHSLDRCVAQIRDINTRPLKLCTKPRGPVCTPVVHIRVNVAQRFHFPQGPGWLTV